MCTYKNFPFSIQTLWQVSPSRYYTKYLLIAHLPGLFSLHELLIELPNDRRCIWIENDEINLDERIFYKNEESLKEAESIINEIADNHWINVMLGNSYSKDECIKIQQHIVQQLRTPVVRAFEMDSLVRASM